MWLWLPVCGTYELGFELAPVVVAPATDSVATALVIAASSAIAIVLMFLIPPRRIVCQSAAAAFSVRART
jgi:hypothetical protein